MDDVIDSIRAAVANDAPPEARAAGITACRAVLAALEATSGVPLAEAAVADPNPLVQMMGALKRVPTEQLLDLAISKLRAALPAGTQAPTVAPLKFHMIPVPAKRGTR
ncbi:hypothetical protein BH11MYX2_BH11MYX2_36900 [soil metagenome]